MYCEQGAPGFLLKVSPDRGNLSQVSLPVQTIPSPPPNPSYPPTLKQDLSNTPSPLPPLLAPITAPYKQKVFPPCVDKGGKKAGKNSLTREHSSSLSLSLLCILAACTHYQPPLWTADCWHIRRGGQWEGWEALTLNLEQLPSLSKPPPQFTPKTAHNSKPPPSNKHQPSEVRHVAIIIACISLLCLWLQTFPMCDKYGHRVYELIWPKEIPAYRTKDLRRTPHSGSLLLLPAPTFTFALSYQFNRKSDSLH